MVTAQGFLQLLGELGHAILLGDEAVDHVVVAVLLGLGDHAAEPFHGLQPVTKFALEGIIGTIVRVRLDPKRINAQSGRTVISHFPLLLGENGR